MEADVPKNSSVTELRSNLGFCLIFIDMLIDYFLYCTYEDVNCFVMKSS